MSYIDQSRRSSPTSIAVVVGVHIAIGYAFISGLAYTVIHGPPRPTVVTDVPLEPPPPPRHDIVPPKTRTATEPTLAQPQPRDDPFKLDPILRPLPPIDAGPSGNGGGVDTTPSQPPKPSQAHDAVPGSDRLRWITTEDYPAAALRQGLQGSVVISAMVGTDGHVRSCIVTQSSGSQLLDDTTCRLYTKRAHFTPARDADGNPISAQRTDRFRWQIPNE